MMDPRDVRRTHRRLPSGLKYALLFPVLAALFALPMDRGVAQDAPLQIQKGFFKSTKYVYRGAEPQKVSGFFGYTEEFTGLLGNHPASLDELNRAKPWQVGTLIGSVGILAVSVKMLIETLEDVDDVNSGTIDSDTGSGSWTDVGLLAGFGAVMVVSAIKANGHFKSAVEIFNQADASPDDGDWKPSFSLGLRTVDGRRALSGGLSFTW